MYQQQPGQGRGEWCGRERSKVTAAVTSACLLAQQLVSRGALALISDGPVDAYVGAASVVVLAFI